MSGRIVGSGSGRTNGSEAQGVNFDAQSGHVLLLELASQVTLDEGGLLDIPKEVSDLVPLALTPVGSGVIATLDEGGAVRCPARKG